MTPQQKLLNQAGTIEVRVAPLMVVLGMATASGGGEMLMDEVLEVLLPAGESQPDE